MVKKKGNKDLIAKRLKKNTEQFEQFEKELKKDFNDNIFFKGKDDNRRGYDRFSTGSFFLDHACGGGIPLHRVTALFGEQSTSKTTLAKKIMIDAQKRDRLTHEYIPDDFVFDEDSKLFVNEQGEFKEPYTCAFVDLEGTYDTGWFEDMGGIDDLVYKAYPQYGEQAVDIVQKFILSGRFDVIVIDSLAAMTPIVEIEKSAEDNHMALQARLINSACRKWVSSVKKFPYKEQPTIITINQIRENIGMMFGPKDTLPGGKGQKFMTSVEIRTRKGKAEHLDKDKLKTLNQEMHGVVEKNKTAPPKMEYSFRLAVSDYTPPESGDKKYPIPFNRGDVLEHVEIIKLCYKFNLLGKDEKEGFFVNLIDQEPVFYKKKTDLLNEWIYYSVINYRLVKRNLLELMKR